MDQRWQNARDALGNGSPTIFTGTSSRSLNNWARRLSYVGTRRRAPVEEQHVLRRWPDLVAGVFVALLIFGLFIGITVTAASCSSSNPVHEMNRKLPVAAHQ